MRGRAGGGGGQGGRPAARPTGATALGRVADAYRCPTKQGTQCASDIMVQAGSVAGTKGVLRGGALGDGQPGAHLGPVTTGVVGRRASGLS